MAKDVDALIRKKMKRRQELEREIRQIDVELEALANASTQFSTAAHVKRCADDLLTPGRR